MRLRPGAARIVRDLPEKMAAAGRPATLQTALPAAQMNLSAALSLVVVTFVRAQKVTRSATFCARVCASACLCVWRSCDYLVRARARAGQLRRADN